MGPIVVGATAGALLLTGLHRYSQQKSEKTPLIILALAAASVVVTVLLFAFVWVTSGTDPVTAVQYGMMQLADLPNIQADWPLWALTGHCPVRPMDGLTPLLDGFWALLVVASMGLLTLAIVLGMTITLVVMLFVAFWSSADQNRRYWSGILMLGGALLALMDLTAFVQHALYTAGTC